MPGRSAWIDLAGGIQNFSLSLTYFDIDYQGKVQPPGFPADFLTREMNLPP